MEAKRFNNDNLNYFRTTYSCQDSLLSVSISANTVSRLASVWKEQLHQLGDVASYCTHYSCLVDGRR